MKVEILKSSVIYRGQTYLPGDSVNMVESDAQRLINKGIARTVAVPRKKKMPFRPGLLKLVLFSVDSFHQPLKILSDVKQATRIVLT